MNNFKTNTLKGNIGERIVKEYFESIGCIVYTTDSDGSHPFDMIVKQDKELFIVDVKTKPRRMYYKDTGLNLSHFVDYLEMGVKHNMNVYLVFVDEYTKSIYGNYVTVLNQKKLSMDKNGNMFYYPIEEGNYIYFPLFNMETLKELSTEEVNELSTYTTRSYDYGSSSTTYE